MNKKATITAEKPSRAALIIFIIGVFMSALDNGIISSALSTLDNSFGVTEITGTWSITLYTLGMAVATPIIGKLADQHGRKKLFLFEISTFALGSFAVSLSPNFSLLLIARLIQSIGGGGIFIIASSYILSTYDKTVQGKLLGALGAVNGIASVVGPALGALILSQTNDWRWLFTINIPIAILVILFGTLFIPETRATVTNRLDWYGLITLACGILSIMLAISGLQSANLLASLTSITVLLPLLLGFIFFVAFVQLEKHIKTDTDPFLPYQLLKRKQFLLILLMGLLSGGVIALFVFIPSFTEQTFGVSANLSGAMMSGIGIGSIIGSGLGGALVSKLGAAKTVIWAGVLSVIGFSGMAYLSTTLVSFLITSLIAGTGFGMVMGAPFSVLMSQIAAEKDTGVALGTLSVSRQMGITIAPIIYATLISAGFNQRWPYPLTQSVEHTYRKLLTHNDPALLNKFHLVAGHVYSTLFLVAIIISIIFIIGGYLLNQHKRPKRINL